MDPTVGSIICCLCGMIKVLLHKFLSMSNACVNLGYFLVVIHFAGL